MLTVQDDYTDEMEEGEEMYSMSVKLAAANHKTNAPSPPPTLPTSKPSKSRRKPKVKSNPRTEVRTQTETGPFNNFILLYLFLAFSNF